MLTELNIHNFAIIDSLQLQFAPGFNVLTGETGAGKSIIIDAMTLMLGGRADITLIRTGAPAAIVEGTFALNPTMQAILQPLLEQEALLEEDNQPYIILSRELREGGRNICRINGRTVSLSILREIGDILVDVHGQSEHLSLLQVKAHLDLLDRYAGTWPQRQHFAEQVRQFNTLRRELDDLRAAERDATRQIELLSFQVQDIESAGLLPNEEDDLRNERTRLANAEKLARLTQQGLNAIEGGSSEPGLELPGATDLLGELVAALDGLLRIDPRLQPQSDLAITLAEQLDDISRALISYRDEIEFNPTRLDEVEERLGLIQNLKRKYGDSIEAILAFAEQARHKLDTITHAEERIAELSAREQALLKTLGQAGWALHLARQAAAEHLARSVETELQDLRMERARFAVHFDHPDDPSGAVLPDGRPVRFDAAGIDRVEFLIAPNPGEGFKPLVKIASGGETARLMLALKGVLARADETPTLIFDEIDQGIGGRVGTTVGQKLWRLSDGHQVLCITHLPQLASYGDAHYKVEKAVDERRTTTQVLTLDAHNRVDELAQMLGTLSESTRTSARELLAHVAHEKATTRA